MVVYRYVWLVTALSCITACMSARTAVSSQALSTSSAGPWQQYADVRQAGFDAETLRAVCARADALRSGALMVVYRGHVLVACGDVSRPFESHSVRKSLVSGLYGVAISRREIDLDATLADFAIDERTPLTPTERAVTLRQLISARSGVYLPAAYAPTSQNQRPARGSHAPGTHWFYNNWDFNVAGIVLERATKADLYEYFMAHLAEPLGMEDWNPSFGFRVYEPTKSRHPAHTFRISTRDLARFGWLYLQNGNWRGRRLLPSNWVADSAHPHTDDGDGTGYGYMWWTYQRGSSFTAQYPHLGRLTFYRALGTGEQGLWIFPEADLVVVHRADTDHSHRVDSGDHWALVESIMAARRGKPDRAPRLQALTSTPLTSQQEPVTVPPTRRLTAADLDPYLGSYRLQPGADSIAGRRPTPDGTVSVFLYEGMPFVHIPGVGDVQIFATARDTFTTRALPDFTISFERGAGEVVRRVAFTTGGRVVAAADAQPQAGPFVP